MEPFLLICDLGNGAWRGKGQWLRLGFKAPRMDGSHPLHLCSLSIDGYLCTSSLPLLSLPLFATGWYVAANLQALFFGHFFIPFCLPEGYGLLVVAHIETRSNSPLSIRSRFLEQSVKPSCQVEFGPGLGWISRIIFSLQGASH